MLVNIFNITVYLIPDTCTNISVTEIYQMDVVRKEFLYYVTMIS